jgi:hypothetical protein
MPSHGSVLYYHIFLGIDDGFNGSIESVQFRKGILELGIVMGYSGKVSGIIHFDLAYPEASYFPPDTHRGIDLP